MTLKDTMIHEDTNYTFARTSACLTVCPFGLVGSCVPVCAGSRVCVSVCVPVRLGVSAAGRCVCPSARCGAWLSVGLIAC